MAPTWDFAPLLALWHAIDAVSPHPLEILPPMRQVHLHLAIERNADTEGLQCQVVWLVGPKGEAVSWLRAMLRYVLSWLWFLPSLATSYLSDIHSPSAIFGVCVVGMVGYTALARLHPQRQFWHDVVCGTRLVTVRATRTV